MHNDNRLAQSMLNEGQMSFLQHRQSQLNSWAENSLYFCDSVVLTLKSITQELPHKWAEVRMGPRRVCFCWLLAPPWWLASHPYSAALLFPDLKIGASRWNKQLMGSEKYLICRKGGMKHFLTLKKKKCTMPWVQVTQSLETPSAQIKIY